MLNVVTTLQHAFVSYSKHLYYIIQVSVYAFSTDVNVSFTMYNTGIYCI